MPRRKNPTRRSPLPAADPPTVAEVRAIRAEMWRRAGRTVPGLIELAKREAAALPAAKRTTPKRRARRAA